MTALDTTSTLTTGRAALDQLDVLRELVADALDRPSAAGLRMFATRAQGFLHFEANEVLPEVDQGGFAPDRVRALVEGHEALAARLNLLAWAEAGSAAVQNLTHQLRHELLVQIDNYQALRLPRGSLFSER